MRGLNLSRLAKASEGSFFKSQQATQASELRKTLSPEELKSIRQRPKPEPSVDTLSEISAQSAYKRLDPPPAAHVSEHATIVSRIASAPGTVGNSTTPDPSIMRVLGSSRLQLYQQYRQATPQVRPLPGSERYAEGAILGMTSFSVATAFVASFGLIVGLGVYLNPGIVDYVKDRTRRFARRMEATVGARMREKVEKMKADGPVVGEARREWIGGLLRSAVGGRELEEQRKARADKEEKG